MAHADRVLADLARERGRDLTACASLFTGEPTAARRGLAEGAEADASRAQPHGRALGG